MLRIAFDIGGVISRYPEQMKALMLGLSISGVEVHVVTDMNKTDAILTCEENGILHIVPPENVHSANWSKYGDLCKTKLCEELKIDILIDDRPDYCAMGNFIGLVLSPRPEIPYYHSSWINKSTSAVVVPPEEYEEFKEWRKQKT